MCPLLAQNAVQKAELTLALSLDLPIDTMAIVSDPGGIPGRPAKPELVAHTSLKSKPLTSPEGRALLLHAIAHIELNAIDLALDVVWRFAGMPEDFYRDWVRIAKEEAKHFYLSNNIWSAWVLTMAIFLRTTRFGKWLSEPVLILWPALA